MRFSMRGSLSEPSGLESSLGSRGGCDLVIAGVAVRRVGAGCEYEVLGAGVWTGGMSRCG